MYNLDVVFDCTDPDAVSRFWLTALEGYDYPGSDPDGPPGCPPPGFTTWEAWADSMGIPEDQRYGTRTIIDVVGNRPDIFFIAVPEGKQVKNRLHLDIKATRDVAPEDRLARQDAEAERLVAAGATLLRRVHDPDGSHLVLQDVEGNEFCIT
ncbi:VOC family protein [Haloactinopolyspora sp.]|uniref:VOC family protein n=1 Tax=Haloactinopolyspora sp. TaxID=1966353 RepID=UPI00260A7BE2|nr:VOC family protein [Haloactinopolyspora sp.]